MRRGDGDDPTDSGGAQVASSPVSAPASVGGASSAEQAFLEDIADALSRYEPQAQEDVVTLARDSCSYPEQAKAALKADGWAAEDVRTFMDSAQQHLCSTSA